MTTAFYWEDQPKFEHDCPKCKFIRSVRRDDGFTIDIYKSCSASSEEWLIRTGNNPEDYSTPAIESMAMMYALRMGGK